jgi:hypothetical protein
MWLIFVAWTSFGPWRSNGIEAAPTPLGPWREVITIPATNFNGEIRITNSFTLPRGEAFFVRAFSR